MGRVGICPPRFWQNKRCSGDVPNYYLAYTRHVEFISVDYMENYYSWGSSADLSHAKVDKKNQKNHPLSKNIQEMARTAYFKLLLAYTRFWPKRRWSITDFGLY